VEARAAALKPERWPGAVTEPRGRQGCYLSGRRDADLSAHCSSD
jgi:hypothetical protein